jgi:hypothetical protein
MNVEASTQQERHDSYRTTDLSEDGREIRRLHIDEGLPDINAGQAIPDALDKSADGALSARIGRSMADGNKRGRRGHEGATANA